MEPPVESLTMYGRPTDLPKLEWKWVDQRLRAAGSYWVTPSGSVRAPTTRPVWGLWRAGRFELSIGSPRIGAQIVPGTAVTVNLGSDTDVVIVEGVVGAMSGEPAALAEYNVKYDWNYTVAEYGPLTIVNPTKVMAWRSAGWAGREGFQEAGRWTFDSPGESGAPSTAKPTIR